MQREVTWSVCQMIGSTLQTMRNQCARRPYSFGYIYAKGFSKESTTKIICILIQCISNFASKDKTKVSLWLFPVSRGQILFIRLLLLLHSVIRSWLPVVSAQTAAESERCGRMGQLVFRLFNENVESPNHVFSGRTGIPLINDELNQDDHSWNEFKFESWEVH